MAKTTAVDWIASVDEALAELKKTCSQIFVDRSLDGRHADALTPPPKHADVIKGRSRSTRRYRSAPPTSPAWLSTRAVPEMIPGVGSDIKDPNSKELAYAELPVATLRQIYVLCAVTAGPAAARQVPDAR